MKRLALLLALASMEAANACGFHGALGDGFSALHPRSIQVAFALHDAVEERMVEAPMVQAGGYMRAVLRVNALHRRLASLPAPSSLLLVDSGLWTQFEPLAVHAAGPRPGDVVILTSEPVLAALLDGRLPAGMALERNMLVVDGEAAAAAAVRRLLSGALTREDS